MKGYEATNKAKMSLNHQETLGEGKIERVNVNELISKLEKSANFVEK